MRDRQGEVCTAVEAFYALLQISTSHGSRLYISVDALLPFRITVDLRRHKNIVGIYIYI